MAKFVWALDFDGVLCDSVDETGLSGWRTCARVFGDKMSSEPVQSKVEEEELLAKWRVVRPAMETGWEAAVMIHLLHHSSSTAALLAGFEAERDAVLAKYNLSVADMKRLFAETRDAWIADDLEGWLSASRFYTQPVAGLRTLLQQMDAQGARGMSDVYIITTKGKPFALKLLQRAGLDIPEDHVFGLGSGPKADVLASIVDERRQQGLSPKVCFVEDRVAALQSVAGKPGLEEVELILAGYGYNTAAHRSEARELGFQVLDEAEMKARFEETAKALSS